VPSTWLTVLLALCYSLLYVRPSVANPCWPEKMLLRSTARQDAKGCVLSIVQYGVPFAARCDTLRSHVTTIWDT